MFIAGLHRVKTQLEGRISTPTHLVYLTLITGYVPVAHPFAFQQPQQKLLKTNSGPWAGQALLRLVPCTHTREAVLVGSGTQSSNYPTRDT